MEGKALTLERLRYGCRYCHGSGYVREHQTGHTHYETDAGEPCPEYHYSRVICAHCNFAAQYAVIKQLVEALREGVSHCDAWRKCRGDNPPYLMSLEEKFRAALAAAKALEGGK